MYTIEQKLILIGMILLAIYFISKTLFHIIPYECTTGFQKSLRRFSIPVLIVLIIIHIYEILRIMFVY
jgi:hypothetical protein